MAYHLFLVFYLHQPAVTSFIKSVTDTRIIQTMADAPRDSGDAQQSTLENDRPNEETNTGAIACSTTEASNSTHPSINESNPLG